MKKLIAISTTAIIIGVGIVMEMSECFHVEEPSLVGVDVVQWKIQLQDTCNQKQKYGNKSTIPKEVCIPLEHVISNIYPSVDLNGDGLEDFVFDHHKEILENGDSIFLSIYLQRIDGTYRLSKDLANINPIYFETYEYSKEFENSLSSKLKDIWNIYGIDSVYQIYLNERKIEIWMNVEAHIDYRLHYTYSNEKDTWVLLKWQEYTDYNNTTLEREIPKDWKLSIEEFDYKDYLDW